MMKQRLRSKWVLGGVVATTSLLAACTQFAPLVAPVPAGMDVGAVPAITEVQAVPTAAPGGLGSVSGRQSVAVRRGPISQTLALGGRVAGREEIPLSYPVPARVDTVAVK